MPFVASNIDEQSTWTNYKLINTAMNNLITKMTNVITFPTKGFKTDKIHYQNEGMIALSNAFANAIINGKFLENSVSTVFRGNSRINSSIVHNKGQSQPTVFGLYGRRFQQVKRIHLVNGIMINSHVDGNAEHFICYLIISGN